jgi:hypothetical protein
VEWEYLEAIMLKLGFVQRWVDIIMGMVKSVIFFGVVQWKQVGRV